MNIKWPWDKDKESVTPATPSITKKPCLTEVAVTPYQGFFSLANVSNKMWAGTYSGGDKDRIYEYFPQRTVKDLKTGESIYCIMECSTGGVLIGTEGAGLYYSRNMKDFKVRLKKTEDIYALLEHEKYFYAWPHRNSPIEFYIYESKNKTSWHKMLHAKEKQCKCAAIFHGCPQCFGYDFKKKYGIRFVLFPGKNKWTYGKMQKRRRYLDIHVDGDTAFLANTYMGGNSPYPKEGDMGPAGVAKFGHKGIKQVLETPGQQIGKTIARSPYDKHLYFGTIAEWKGYKKAELWRSLTGEKGTWTKVITFKESEVIDQCFHAGGHYIATKQRKGHGRIYRLEYK